MLPATTEALQWIIKNPWEQPSIIANPIPIRRRNTGDVPAAQSRIQQMLEDWPTDTVEAVKLLVTSLAVDVFDHTVGDGEVNVLHCDGAVHIMVRYYTDEVPTDTNHAKWSGPSWQTLLSGLSETCGVVIRQISDAGKTVRIEIRKPDTP